IAAPRLGDPDRMNAGGIGNFRALDETGEVELSLPVDADRKFASHVRVPPCYLRSRTRSYQRIRFFNSRTASKLPGLSARKKNGGSREASASVNPPPRKKSLPSSWVSIIRA